MKPTVVFIFSLISFSLSAQDIQSEIKIVASVIYNHINDKEDKNFGDINIDSLNDNELKILHALLLKEALSLKLPESRKMALLFGGVCAVSSLVVVASYAVPHLLGWQDCSEECPENTMTLDALCYELGVNAECAQYYQDFYGYDTIPPYPIYLQQCSSAISRTLIGQRIPFLTPESICGGKKTALNSLVALSAVPAATSFCGFVLHGSKYLYGLYKTYRSPWPQQPFNFLEAIIQDEREALWFNNVLEHLKKNPSPVPSESSTLLSKV